jgi:glycosyltransferase involved in cell wall biosynthesis
MAAGVPFITLNYPHNASKELCTLDCGMVVEPSPNAVASAVVELYGDENRWRMLSGNALKAAKMYDWDMVTNQVENFFGRVVDGSEK